MSFIDNIASLLGVKDTFTTCDRILILGDCGVYLEGVKTLKAYTKTKVEVLVKSGGIIVVGENLKISKFCNGDMAIQGKVNMVERV